MKASNHRSSIPDRSNAWISASWRMRNISSSPCVEKGKTVVDWRKIPGIRPFLEYRIKLKPADEITPQLEKALPDSEKIKDAVVKVVLEYPEAARSAHRRSLAAALGGGQL